MTDLLSIKNLPESILKLWRKTSEEIPDLLLASTSLLLISTALCILYNFVLLSFLGVTPNKIGISVYDVILFDEIIWCFIILFALLIFFYISKKLFFSINHFLLIITSTVSIFFCFVILIIKPYFSNYQSVLAINFTLIIASIMTSFLTFGIYLMRLGLMDDLFDIYFRKPVKPNKIEYKLKNMRQPILIVAVHITLLILCYILAFKIIKTNSINEDQSFNGDFAQNYLPIIFTTTPFSFYILHALKKIKFMIFFSIAILYLIIIPLDQYKTYTKNFYCEKCQTNSAIELKNNKIIDTNIIKTFSSGSILTMDSSGVGFIKSEEVSRISFKIKK